MRCVCAVQVWHGDVARRQALSLVGEALGGGSLFSLERRRTGGGILDAPSYELGVVSWTLFPAGCNWGGLEPCCFGSRPVAGGASLSSALGVMLSAV